MNRVLAAVMLMCAMGLSACFQTVGGGSGQGQETSLFRNAKGLVSSVFKIDGTVAGLVKVEDLRPALNLLGARFGRPDAGDLIVKGDDALLDWLERRVEEERVRAEAWAPTAVLTNEYFAFEGMDPVDGRRFLGTYTVRDPVWPGARTNWVSRDALYAQYQAGSTAKIEAERARIAAKQQAIAQVTQLAAAGLISKESQQELLAQILAASGSVPAITGTAVQVEAPAPAPSTNAAPAAAGGGLRDTVFGPFIIPAPGPVPQS
jgi:hypothetical protein